MIRRMEAKDRAWEVMNEVAIVDIPGLISPPAP